MTWLHSISGLLLCIAFLSPTAVFSNDYDFASIEFLIEQEVGRHVLPKIYKNIGIDISIEPLPAPRAQQHANAGTKAGEIMRIWTYGNENQNTVRVPTPYYYLETMPFILKGRRITIEDKSDLSGYELTKVRGVKHTDNITKGLSRIYDVNSTKRMFTLLSNRRVDIALTNTLDGELMRARYGFNNIVATGNPLAKLPLYNYIHKTHAHLVPKVDAEIQRLAKSGELAAMISDAEKKVIKKVLRSR